MPYEVKIYLNTPIAFHPQKPLYPIHFDSLLMGIKAQREGSIDFAMSGDAKKIEIPIEMVGEKYKIYKASAMKIDTGKSKARREVYVSSQSWIDYARPYTKFTSAINPGSGPYRQKTGYRMLLETPYVVFCFDGDVNKVADLLNDLIDGGIGARTGVGYGRVRNIEIRKSNDYTLIDADGYPARILPVDEIKASDPRWPVDVSTYTPPYWYGEKVMCYLPPLWKWWPKPDPKAVIKKLQKK